MSMGDEVVVREVTPSEILERLEILEKTTEELNREVKGMRAETKDMVSAFNAAQGAFIFLEWLARFVKPILFIGGLVAAFIFWVKGVKV